MKIRKLLTILLLAVVLIVAILAWSLFWSLFVFSWLSPNNVGLPFGYYGEYNRVRSKLKQVSGIQVVSTHLHKDLWLEDFGFVLQTDKGLRFRLQFFDGKQTYELFKRSGGVFIQGHKGSSYSLGPGNRLEESVGQNIRNASDVLRNFDEIVEIVESDNREGIADSSFNDATLPKDYLYIYYPLSY